MILETDSTPAEPQLTPQPSFPGNLEAEAPSSAQPGIWSQRLRRSTFVRGSARLGVSCHTADNQPMLAGPALALPSSAPSSAATLAPSSPPLCPSSLLPPILCPFKLSTRHTVPRLVLGWLLLSLCLQHKCHPGGLLDPSRGSGPPYSPCSSCSHTDLP